MPDASTDQLLKKLALVEERYTEIENLLSDPEVATDYSRVQTLAKERSTLEGRVTMLREYRSLLTRRQDAHSILEDAPDAEMAELARDELESADIRISRLDQDLKMALLPKDPNDDKDVIVEIREGVGGLEAALFAGDLYRMYTRYAQLQGWQVEVLNSNAAEKGGFKEVVFEVKGSGAFSKLKFERGAHRVQRVPLTEASGRIHTSTATVAVLPEADEVEVDINPDDLRVDIFHASGHGGQNVNKVASAVRIVHIPTGTVSICQDERSQFKNRQKAMAVLRARIYEAEQRRKDSEITASRRAQVGTGERAEKIRTYNFPQDRITDHRISSSFHGIQQVLDGAVDEIIEALGASERTALLEQALT